MDRSKKAKILICDDDESIRLGLKQILIFTYEIRLASQPEEALFFIKKERFELAIVDIEMNQRAEGLRLIPKLLEIQELLPILVYSGHTNFQFVRDALKLGAIDYIPKDAGKDELILAIERTMHQKELQSKKSQTNFELSYHQKKYCWIGSSLASQNVLKWIEKARSSTASILITGETGTGKEVVARLLRRTMPDGTLEPFVAVDSATIQSQTAESILFGYEKGAFTGAEKNTSGLFEAADGGTIYFDELGNMPVEIQNKLLRVIQEKEVLRLGATLPMHLDFRVIAATNKNLEDLVKQGKFKEDLYQRLAVIQIHLPPLRERKDDIDALLAHFNSHLAFQFLPETIQTLKLYDFPGNIRELQNLMQYLETMAENNVITPLDLPPKFLKNGIAAASFERRQESNARNEINFYQRVEDFEKEILSSEYKRLGGNISRISAVLEMDRSYLHAKLKKYGIHEPNKNH